MKVLTKPVEMVAWFTENGTPNPVRFRIRNDDQSTTVIKIDKIIFKEKEKLAGNFMIVFRCQSLINGVTKIYELKYELNTCRWILFKI